MQQYDAFVAQSAEDEDVGAEATYADGVESGDGHHRPPHERFERVALGDLRRRLELAEGSKVDPEAHGRVARTGVGLGADDLADAYPEPLPVLNGGHGARLPGTRREPIPLHGKPQKVDMSVESVNVFAAFVFGMLSFLSPCVLPLLPGYMSMMSGYSAAELAEGQSSTRKMLRVTLLFVAGFTAVFVALGATATSIGSALLRNSATITNVAGWIVVAMGLFIAVSAVWNPGLLMPMMRERRVEVRPSRLGNWAPPVMGAAFGFGWTPCIGPTLAAILTVAATEETVAEGMFLLLVYSLGLGIPFILAGIGITRAYSAFGWLKRHFTPITVGSGVLLAGFGLLMVTGRLVDLSRWFQDWLPEFFWNI